MAKSDAQRKKEYRDRMKASGLKEIRIKILAKDESIIKPRLIALAEKLSKDIENL